jgi:hypothetical protein
MPRVEFEGIGDPIPSIALPPFGGDNNLPPTVLTFTDNADFPIAQYRDLGFTHFEVWCVGAAGGRGGDASNAVPSNGYDEVMRPVPQDIWDTYKNTLRGFDAALTPPKNFDTDYYMTIQIPGNPNYPPGGVPGQDYGWPVTHNQYLEITNPNHLMLFRTWRSAPLVPQRIGMGGGGGGGGLHKVSGLLESLGDTVSIVVGKAGADASLGQVKVLGLWTPGMPDVYFSYNPADVVQSYLNTWPGVHPTYLNPQAGQDGGASTFADTVCQASGGKGGAPGMMWNGSKFIPDGHGGAGGTGGTTVAGGGGAGSTVEGANGSDGIWRPDLGIGGGGGGGKGGREAEYSGGGVIGGFGPAPVLIQHLASAGGQGSYSFADTSVYGQRGTRQGASQMSSVYANGQVTFVPLQPENIQLVIPGAGGGARPTKNLKVGSRAPGYSPDGAVVIRLTRIT